MKKRVAAVVITALVCLLSTALFAEETYDYTLLIYLNGSDLESMEALATDDLEEMVHSDIGERVAVVIETGGTKEWADSALLPEIKSNANQRWQMTDEGLVLLEENSKTNMGAATTLSDFLDFGMSRFPSDQYALMMWNHGNGSIVGFGSDEHFAYDSLLLSEMAAALETNYLTYGKKFDLISFDACLMSTLENAYVLAPYSDYLLSSEELVPGHGWSYGIMMDYLSSMADPDPVDFGKVIMDDFIQQAQYADTYYDITCSLVDLQKIPDVVEAAAPMFSELNELFEIQGYSEQILRSRLKSESYGEAGALDDEGTDSDMVDLGDFAKNVSAFAPIVSETLLEAINEAVVYNHSGPFNANATGLSIYLPGGNQKTMDIAGTVMEQIGMPKSYIQFIDKLHSLLDSDEGYNVEAADMTFDQGVIHSDDLTFTYKIDPANYSYINHISTYMGKLNADRDIQYLAHDDLAENRIHGDGTLLGVTLDNWVTISGIPVAMYYEKGNSDGSTNYYIPVQVDGANADLVVIFDRSHPSGKIIGYRLAGGEWDAGYTRSTYSFDGLTHVEFLYEYDLFNETTGTYVYDGWYTMNRSVIVDESGLTLEWGALEEGTYAYAFEIQDIYGNNHYSPWVFYDYRAEPEEMAVQADVLTTEYPWLADGADSPSDWAVGCLEEAFDNGLMTAAASEDFTSNITRESFCELAVNLYEQAGGVMVMTPSKSAFTDTDNLTVTKAYELGIVSGYGDGLFGPEDPITREQLVTMFYRTLILLDPSYSDNVYPQPVFDDMDQVAGYAEDATEALVHFGIINGVGDNLFAPKDNATVEQSLKMVNGVYELYKAEQ